MLSLSKVLLLVAVAVGVFWLFRLLRAKGGQQGGQRVARRAAPRAVDLRKCGVCGVYVGETDGACGRPNCPAA